MDLLINAGGILSQCIYIIHCTLDISYFFQLDLNKAGKEKELFARTVKIKNKKMERDVCACARVCVSQGECRL